MFPAPLLWIFTHPYLFLSTTLCLFAFASFVNYAIRRPKGASLVLPTMAFTASIPFIFWFSYLMVVFVAPGIESLPPPGP